MPLYTAQCQACDIEYSYIRKIDDRHDTPDCECGAKTDKVIDAPMVPFEYADSFISPIDGKPVHGREQYFAHMREHNVVPRIQGVGEDVKRQRQYQKEQSRREIRQILERKLEGVDTKTLTESSSTNKYNGQ